MTKDFLLNKNILITGATSGIGKSLTKYLSGHGANILMLSKDESKLDVLYDEIVKKYNTVPCIFKCDLQKLNEEGAIEINKIINENYSGVDAVIFNAAALDKMSYIESYDLATWEKILKINLTKLSFAKLECLQMEIKDLKKLLESTEVSITFQSLKSGRTITEKCSLNKNLIPEGYSFNQSEESDSILCYLTEKKRWEDIKNSTIIKYEVSKNL